MDSRSKPRSLFFAIAAVVCLGLIVPALIIGAVVVGVEQPAIARQRQQQALAVQLDVLARSLSRLVWAIDTAGVREVVEAAAKSPGIVRVQVTDLPQRKYVVDVHATDHQSGTVLHGERDIVYAKRLIGRVTVDLDGSEAAGLMRTQSWLLGWTVLTQVLLSLALILVLLHMRVTRPLRELGKFADALAAGRFSAAVAQRHDDEIGYLGLAMRNMRDALQRYFNEQRDLLHRVQAEEAQVQRQARFFAALSRTNRLIVRQPSEATLYSEVCRICVDTGHARIACVWLADAGEPHVVASAGPFENVFGSARVAPPLVSTVLERAEHCISNDYLADPRTERYHHRAAEQGVLAAAVFPIRRADRVTGALALYTGEPEMFDEPLIGLLDEMAHDLSFALDNIDRECAHQAALHEIEVGFERFRRVFGAAPVSIVIAALDDKTILEVNAAACERYGYRRDELIGRSWAQLGAGASVDDLERLTQLVKEHSTVRDFECRVRVRSGQVRDLVVNGEQIEFAGRECMLTIGTDITERKRMEHALRESEARLSGIVETAFDAIVTIDRQQRIVVFNRAAVRMFRIAAEQVLGTPLDRFIPPRLRDAHRQDVDAFASRDAAAERMAGEPRRVQGVRSDGETFPLAASISRSGAGEGLLMTVVARDTTAEHEAELAREARLKAEAASRAKTDFLSRMSHELRTPLNAVLGFSRLLHSDAENTLTERQKAQVEFIHQAGWHLLELINDVLDVSRIELGRLHIEEIGVALAEALDDVFELMGPQADSWGVALDPAYREQPALQVWGDPVRVRQVLLNVISNAVKYNRPGGSVRVTTSSHPEHVAVHVVDTGIGMTREQLEHLYEPFNRLGRERGGIEGIGIGMALTRQLVDLMHGSIEVRSSPGEGTMVVIALPVSKAPAQAPAPQLPAGPPFEALEPSGVVLYIEDNEVNMILVEQALARLPQVRLAKADQGSQGIEMARALMPDLVLLDMRLPDMDGTQVLQALRSDPATSSLVVISLSASAMPEDIELALRSGATDYWTKPLDLERFIGDVRRLLRARVTAGTTAAR